MEERDILMQTIESLNASIQTLSESHKKEVDSLNARIKELTAQVAWLNRQLFGRKSEKLPIIDPNYPDLFASMQPDNAQQIADAHDEAVEKITQTKEERHQEKKNRIMMEDLPVLEQVILTPDNLDTNLYKKIGQEVTRIVEHKPGQLYIKEIIREKWGLKDNTATAPKGMSGVLIAPMPLLPIYKGIAGASLLAEILLQKYEYHMPYYRQIKQYTHLGMKGLTESTVDGWFKQTMELLKPLYEQYKSKGLGIYAVCVDPDKAEWAQVVKSQELPWVNVNDGLGTASRSLFLYNFQRVPCCLLLTEDGITSVNVGEKPLQAALAKLLK